MQAPQRKQAPCQLGHKILAKCPQENQAAKLTRIIKLNQPNLTRRLGPFARFLSQPRCKPVPNLRFGLFALWAEGVRLCR